ncbi:hypothetical protein I3760_06G026600 [Carya illinoinensis]|nr:hypothetical protein I3760_06G026600 [Carya illinoinensis]
MHRFKIGDAAKNLQVAMNPNSVSGSDDKSMNSVTYKNIEIKVSSTMEVSIREKTLGMSNTGITITNDKDDKYKVKAKAKGILEGYVYQMKNALEDEKIRPKLEPSFKKKIEEAIGHLNGWLKYVQNPQADDNEITKNLKLNKQYYEDIIAKIKQLK